MRFLYQHIVSQDQQNLHRLFPIHPTSQQAAYNFQRFAVHYKCLYPADEVSPLYSLPSFVSSVERILPLDPEAPKMLSDLGV